MTPPKVDVSRLLCKQTPATPTSPTTVGRDRRVAVSYFPLLAMSALSAMTPMSPSAFTLRNINYRLRITLNSMKCYEIFSKLTPELADEIFGYLQQDEKAVYKAMIQNMADRRKLRPVFLERKPRSERHLWLHDALGRKPADDITAQVFQIWLLGAQREMICQFLNGLGIAHDGKGVVEDLPSEPSKEILEGALSKLLEKHRPEIVTAYLHVFQAMDDHGWPTLDEILKTDQRLAFR
jgi:hypothetical protein